MCLGFASYRFKLALIAERAGCFHAVDVLGDTDVNTVLVLGSVTDYPFLAFVFYGLLFFLGRR